MTNFYQDKDVAVLGGSGFVGRHLCRKLEARGANVYVIDNLSRSDGQSMNSAKDFKFDIRRGGEIFLSILSNINPFAVFNLAATVANVEYNQKHHNQMFLDNVQLQAIPVMVCEKLGTPHFLQISSACVYGEDANAPASEGNIGGAPVGANAGYSWAKRMGEQTIQWSNLNRAVIVRPSNIYGPGDWYDDRAHVIPKLIKGYVDGTAKLLGNGLAIREFIYVDDVVGGMLHALEFGADKEAYNLAGYSPSLAMVDLHEVIRGIVRVDYEAPNISSELDPGDSMRYSDSLKMAQIGWDAKTSKTHLYDGLKKTIEAYIGGK